MSQPDSGLKSESSESVSFIEKSEYSDDFGKNPDLRKMEIFDMNEKVWKISKHFLPVIDDFVLWGASMVALSNTLILAGGATPKNGPMDLIFEYHKDFGFRLLEDKLQLRR